MSKIKSQGPGKPSIQPLYNMYGYLWLSASNVSFDTAPAIGNEMGNLKAIASQVLRSLIAAIEVRAGKLCYLSRVIKVHTAIKQKKSTNRRCSWIFSIYKKNNFI